MKMNRRLLIEILSAHAEQLKLNRDAKSTYLTGFPEHRETLEPLLTTAERVKHILTPARPSPAFKQDLQHSLFSAAVQSRAVHPPARLRRVAVKPLVRTLLRHAGKVRTHVLVAATAGSALSLLSLVALFLRSRTSHSSQAVGLV